MTETHDNWLRERRAIPLVIGRCERCNDNRVPLNPSPDQRIKWPSFPRDEWVCKSCFEEMNKPYIFMRWENQN